MGSHGAMMPAGRTRERGNTQPPNEGRVLAYVGASSLRAREYCKGRCLFFDARVPLLSGPRSAVALLPGALAPQPIYGCEEQQDS